MQRVFEMARIRQRVAHRQRGMKDRDYKVADWVWRFYPPNMTDKVTGLPYTGPHQVLDVAHDRSCVQLELPEAFQGRKLKWINVWNVKPLIYTPNGRLFITLPPVIPEPTVATSRVCNLVWLQRDPKGKEVQVPKPISPSVVCTLKGNIAFMS